jgi:hypothetical protein
MGTNAFVMHQVTALATPEEQAAAPLFKKHSAIAECAKTLGTVTGSRV